MPATRSPAFAGEDQQGRETLVRGRRVLRDPAWVGAALALALGLFWLRQWQIAGTAGFSSFPLDDAWIHLHFARNIAEGRGFAYNAGVPGAGSTAPLWTLSLAAGFALLGSHPYWAKVLGIGAGLGTALVVARLAARWTQDRWLALLAGVVTATAGPLVWGALSGMEVSLAALLVTAALLGHADGRDLPAALLLGLAALARPEALLLIPLVWMGRPITWKRTAIFAGVTAACLGPWVAFNLAAGGTPLPATASAKIEGGLVGFLSGTRESVARTFLETPGRFGLEWIEWLFAVNALLPFLIPAGLWVLWRRWGRVAVWPASALLVHPIGMALLAPYRGPGFQEGRYSIHLLPLAIAVAAAGLACLARWPRVRVTAAGLFLLASIAAAPLAADRYAWAVQNIEAMQVHLGRWVAAHTPPGARLALNDVGAIAYFSRREVVDLMGLITPAIIPYRRAGEDGVRRYLEQACPDYLIIFPEWFPKLSAMTERFTPIYRRRLDHNTVSGADEMVVYEARWRRSPAASAVGTLGSGTARSGACTRGPS
jgi:arabinofuranosyltransferase